MAKQAQGEVVDDSSFAEQQRVLQAAEMLNAESGLITVLVDHDDRPKRPEVVNIVRNLRNRGLKEKDVLHPTLFKRAYTILMPKSGAA